MRDEDKCSIRNGRFAPYISLDTTITWTQA